MLRFALGSRITQTHEKLVGHLGTLDERDVRTAVQILVQVAEVGDGCLWELPLAALLEPVRILPRPLGLFPRSHYCCESFDSIFTTFDSSRHGKSG